MDIAAHARAGDLVVEMGCGPGDVVSRVARMYPEVRFLGLDVDAAMVAHARTVHSAPNLTFDQGDITEGRLEVDARMVFGIDVLHHVHDLRRCVEVVAGLLDRDSWWSVIEPDSRNPYIWLHQERMRRAGLDEHHFARRRFEAEVRRSGLRVVRRTTAFVVPGSFGSVPGAVARLERVLERVPGRGKRLLRSLAVVGRTTSSTDRSIRSDAACFPNHEAVEERSRRRDGRRRRLPSRSSRRTLQVRRRR